MAAVAPNADVNTARIPEIGSLIGPFALPGLVMSWRFGIAMGQVGHAWLARPTTTHQAGAK